MYPLDYTPSFVWLKAHIVSHDRHSQYTPKKTHKPAIQKIFSILSPGSIHIEGGKWNEIDQEKKATRITLI